MQDCELQDLWRQFFELFNEVRFYFHFLYFWFVSDLKVRSKILRRNVKANESKNVKLYFLREIAH